MLREARLASAIEHPNVCAIYEVGEAGDEGYIVMQYVPGQSLDQLIARGPATPQLLLSVGIQIADGLQAAHSLGIFHRDLKPQNVMLTDGGLVKILDFGLARRLQPEDAAFDPSKAGAGQGCFGGCDVYGARRDDSLHGAGAVCYGAIERAVGCVGAGRDSVMNWPADGIRFRVPMRKISRQFARSSFLIRSDLSEIVPDDFSRN